MVDIYIFGEIDFLDSENHRIQEITMKTLKIILFLLSFLLQISCSNVKAKSQDGLIGFTQEGQASYYAMKFQFRKTASGERFNQHEKTAAHKKLPFGTIVRVININNGKSVVVKINDRGPFINGRIIDLSRSAFEQIGNVGKGLLKVRIEVI